MYSLLLEKHILPKHLYTFIDNWIRTMSERIENTEQIGKEWERVECEILSLDRVVVTTHTYLYTEVFLNS